MLTYFEAIPVGPICLRALRPAAPRAQTPVPELRFSRMVPDPLSVRRYKSVA